jgi:hypothetical protein
MFWKNKDAGSKLPGPRDIPEPVKKQLVDSGAIDPDVISFLKAVVKNNEKEARMLDVRIFDPADAEARGIKVNDFNSLNDTPEMIIAEGWLNEATKQSNMQIKINIPKAGLLKFEEIILQIEALKEPGSSVFYYMAAGTGAGGPLGRGAAVVKFNDGNSGKKPKKYTIYGASVINMQPTQNLIKLWDSDKARDVAKWLAEGQRPRFC